jgi:cation diffusion facilitator CzcD-associated flavoprotein CzcO
MQQLKKRFTPASLSLVAGYYNYTKGYTPEFKDQTSFKGEIIHPQKMA